MRRENPRGIQAGDRSGSQTVWIVGLPLHAGRGLTGDRLQSVISALAGCDNVDEGCGTKFNHVVEPPGSAQLPE